MRARRSAAVAVHLAMVLTAYPALVDADLPPSAGVPTAAPRRNELGVGSGFTYSRYTPEFGVPVVLQYGRALGGERLWLVVRGSLLLNAESPDGKPMKGSAGGLDLGLEWIAGPPDRARLYLGGAVGGRFYAFPGYGADFRICVGLRAPLTRTGLGAFVEGAGVVGVARLGDESPRTLFQARGEVVAGIRYRF